MKTCRGCNLGIVMVIGVDLDKIYKLPRVSLDYEKPIGAKKNDCGSIVLCYSFIFTSRLLYKFLKHETITQKNDFPVYRPFLDSESRFAIYDDFWSGSPIDKICGIFCRFVHGYDSFIFYRDFSSLPHFWVFLPERANLN